MPRRFFKKVLPRPRHLRDRWFLRPFDALLHDPALWAIHRRSVVRALAVGLFVSMVPIPGQTALAGVLALLIRVNVPVAVLATLFNNPVTMYPLFYLAYRIGTELLGVPPQPFDMELSIEWLTAGLGRLWQPLLLGCLIMGTAIATVGFSILNLLWRLMLAYRFRNRRQLRKWTKKKRKPRGQQQATELPASEE